VKDKIEALKGKYQGQAPWAVGYRSAIEEVIEVIEAEVPVLPVEAVEKHAVKHVDI
jgi:hypothetical protein